jgi:Xaa-Pro dipeptidase
MAVTTQKVSLKGEMVERIQAELRAQQLDGWLLFDFHGQNPVASAVLGLPALTRRYAVLIPPDGAPVALTHRIEQQPWEGWIGDRRIYVTWRELEEGLATLARGRRRLAMEHSPGGAVPYVDLVPAGILDMIRGTGVEIVSSAELVSAFHARWSEEGEASHRRAARAVQETAHAAFRRIADAVRAGGTASEWEVQQWILEELRRRGLTVGVGSIVAVNANAANPHYAPAEHTSSPIREGDLVLIDLYGKEGDAGVYADQTWMGYVGESVPERLRGIWTVLRDARDAAVELLRERHRAGRPVSGGEVDDAARDLITRHGYGEYFVHRTGHSIDTELHGSGPNIDNLETRDTRLLIPRVGFSVEPGIYIPGDVGFRSEINVFMGPDGPEVTTPQPQQELFALLADPAE